MQPRDCSKNVLEFESVYTGVDSKEKATTGQLAQLRDSEESLELRRNSIKNLNATSNSICTRKIQLRNAKVQPRDCSKNDWEFGSVYTGVGSKETTTGPLAQLRDSEESLELRRTV